MNLLTELLRDPAVVMHWRAAQWNRFLPLARRAGLLGRCRYLFDQHDVGDSVPERVRDQLIGALAQTRYVQGQAQRELRHVAKCLGREGIRVMALKGVAYQVAGLPPAPWRNLADVDLLLARSDMDRAEQAMQRSGWLPNGEFDAYDQHYYRAWMHELPPLIHRARAMEVDLHHNLAPPVSRIRIDADRLWAAARSIDAGCDLTVWILGPADMLLHNAVHLFMNDELRGGLRDVVDFRDLFDHFVAEDAAFEQVLLARAIELGCGRALYYAVDTAHRLAGLDASPQFLGDVGRFAPKAPTRVLMARLIDQALAPRRVGSRRSALAERLLFIRSHWIRMPPLMLARHLLHKTLKARQPGEPEPQLPG